MTSRSRTLCGISCLGGVTRDMPTPDPPVEPMGVLHRYPQFPLKPTKTYNMVAADHSRSSTLGTLENVLLKFGDVELYIQVQVVEDAPFDILLGQPFFAVAGAQTSHSTSGEQLITLKDPNSGSVVTLATKGKGESF